jgi:4-hydroxy-tetrahydrodipicolinate synthase
MSKKIKGVFPATITPYTKDFEIDEEALKTLIKFWIEKGLHALIPCGSTGEFSAMTLEERKRVFDIYIDEVDGRVPVICGTGAVRTEDAVMLTKYAKDINADGVMVIPSYYIKPKEEELYLYYEAIAKVGIPVVVYNNPGTSKVDMQPEFIVKLANEFDSIKYVKESSGDITRIHDIIRLDENKRLSVFIGADNLTLEGLLMGAEGAVSVSANFIPEQNVELYQLAVEKKDLKNVLELYYKILPLLAVIEESGKFCQYAKAGVELRGFHAGEPRRPLLPLSEREKETLKKYLRRLGVVQ